MREHEEKAEARTHVSVPVPLLREREREREIENEQGFELRQPERINIKREIEKKKQRENKYCLLRTSTS